MSSTQEIISFTRPAATGTPIRLYTAALIVRKTMIPVIYGTHHRKLNLIRLMTVRDKSIRIKIDIRLDDIRTNSAFEIVMSLPLPMAIPTSAGL